MKNYKINIYRKHSNGDCSIIKELFISTIDDLTVIDISMMLLEKYLKMYCVDLKVSVIRFDGINDICGSVIFEKDSK